MRETPIRAEAVVTEVLKPGLFRVALPNGKLSLGHFSKRLKRENPDVAPGDRVELELTPFDFDSARIRAVPGSGGESA
jgi:translation initiation factor IF-1